MNIAEKIEKIHKNEAILLDYLKEIDSKLPQSKENYKIKDILEQLNIDIQLVTNQLDLQKVSLDIKEKGIEKTQKEEREKLSLSNFPFFNIEHYRSGSSVKKVSFVLNGYQDLSYLISDVLDVTIAAIENESEDVRYSASRMLKLVQKLIPEEEFKLLDNLHTPIIEKDYSKYTANE